MSVGSHVLIRPDASDTGLPPWCRRIDDDSGVELIWYKRGRAPYYRGGQLDFLNQAIRSAELDHPELTGEFELYFHALENALGLQLPQQDIQEGTVQAAQWARSNSGRG
ncbi:MAG: hypothetical protein QOI83_3846 [Streptomycetaceae bacterium]|nr:hypothetical protein [Streptomycetaceae bacterium]